MGVKSTNSSSMAKAKEQKAEMVNRSHFEYLYVVGRGGFGKVWKVLSKKYKITYALKEMSKAKIIDKKSEKSIKYERELLSKLRHPFIVNMQYAFQDYENLYLVMDLLNGGDLRYHVSRYRKFTEEQTKFFVCCLLLGLDYIHTNSILHRDIKPENLVLDDKGYVRITDFGIAKVYQKENSSETSGTPGYMSPEVMCAQNHTIAVDYFALGVLTYEFMNGRRPYVGKTRKEIKEMIMSRQVQVKKNEIPDGWSSDAADFVNRLLQRKPANRLGLRGPAEVKDHPWVKYFDWKGLYEKTLDAPFIPKIGDNFDKKYCDAPDKIGEETLERYDKFLREEATKQVFKDFTYFSQDDEKRENSPKKSLNNPHQSIPSTLNIDDETPSNKVKSLERTSSIISIEQKMNRFKKPNVSSSASSLLKQYRMNSNLSSNSTGMSTQNLRKGGGSSSSVNLHG